MEDIKLEYTIGDLKEMSFIVANEFKNKDFSKEDIDKFVEDELERGREEAKKILSNLNAIDKILKDGGELNDVEKKSIGDYLKKCGEI